MSYEKRLEALRAMSVEEFVSERFVEAVLESVIILSKKADDIRRARTEYFEALVYAGNSPSLRTMGGVLDYREKWPGRWHVDLFKDAHATHEAWDFRQFLTLVLDGKRDFSPEAKTVLELIRS